MSDKKIAIFIGAVEKYRDSKRSSEDLSELCQASAYVTRQGDGLTYSQVRTIVVGIMDVHKGLPTE